MGYGAAAVERAMTYQQVIMRALAGSLTWLQAADILGIDPRSLRRWRARYERDPVLGLLDRRHRRPSHRTAPRAEVQRILHLYRERYQGFNVRHFHQLARRDHGVTLSYTLIKLALQAAGLVGQRRARGRHRRRREPRPCFGELLHLDGSPHAWLALCPGQRQTLLAILDDATKHLLYAQLWPAETTAAVMTALATVLRTHGLPAALYTDRAGWAFHTPTAGGPISREHLTHVGRALARLGIDHIGAYSPQARGRGERLNRTLQGRLVNELRVTQVTTVDAANAYLRDRFIADYNATFTRPPADPASAFVPLGDVDLEQILCEEDQRVVAQDNTVSFDGVRLQLAKQPGRPTCAGLRVIVRRHLDGSYTIWRGPQRLGHYAPDARVLPVRLDRAPSGRFRVAGAHLPPLPLRAAHPASPRRRPGPRLPVGPGV
jgi:hypothetical protein